MDAATQIKKILDELGDIHNKVMNGKNQNHIGEEMYDKKFTELQKILSNVSYDKDTLKKATNKSKKRRNTLIQCLPIFYEKADENTKKWIETFFENEMDSSNEENRYYLLQNLKSPSMQRLALSMIDKIHFIVQNDSDFDCRDEALRLMGLLKQETSVKVILQMTKEIVREGLFQNLAASLNSQSGVVDWISEKRVSIWTLSVAIKNFPREEFKKISVQTFKQASNIGLFFTKDRDYSKVVSPTPDEYIKRDIDEHAAAYKTISAWALALMGEQKYQQFLEKNFMGRTSEVDEFRAAQAICDLRKWDFEWNRDFIEKNVRNRLLELSK